jgi:hypothetical protein
MNEELCELRAAPLSYPGVRARAHSSLVYTYREQPTYFDNICQILFVAGVAVCSLHYTCPLFALINALLVKSSHVQMYASKDVMGHLANQKPDTNEPIIFKNHHRVQLLCAINK